MAAQLTDAFKKTGAGTVTTLAAPGKAAAAVAITVGATTNYPTDTGLVIAIRQVDSAGELVAGTYTEWSAISTSGTTFTIDPVPVYGSDQVYAAGSTTQVYIPLSSYAHNELIDGILVEHNQDGTHSDITATTVTADEFIVTGSAGANNGWEVGLPTPDTITYNGNRSYDLVFNSNDLTDTLSNGMRTRFTRTVTAPTQCTDLESGSSQYFSKASPTGVTFTDDFTCSAWIKLESYTGSQQVIIGRNTGTSEGWRMYVDTAGQLGFIARRIAANNRSVTTYQSIPLNKWTHVAVSMDLSGSSALTYIDGVSVPNAVVTTGTITALVQGAVDLVVGARSDGATDFFDGKIAQVAVFSSVLSASTIRSYASQTLSGAESTCVSAYSFNNSIVDLNANANNLTANGGALATATDTPFAGGATGTTEYGIITANSFSTNTTLTVQVPEGYALPTSGGISAVAYSTQDTPYGFPRDKGKWILEAGWFGGMTFGITAGTWYSGATAGAGSTALVIPKGVWEVDYRCSILGSKAGTADSGRFVTVSADATSPDNLDTQFRTYTRVATTSANTFISAQHNATGYIALTSQTTHYLLGQSTDSASNNSFSASGYPLFRAKLAYI